MTTMIIIEDLTCTTRQIIHYMTQIKIVILAIASKLLILQYNSLNYAEFTNMTPELQNYHFTLGGNILGLIYKNYYMVIFT